MNPISNQQFSHDAIKFVYQKPDPEIICPAVPIKPFKLKSSKKSKKTKKDFNKKNDK